MTLNRNLLLKFSEIFCFFLVLIGISQISDQAADWQYLIVSDWKNIYIALAVLVSLSFILAFIWEKTNKGKNLHPYLQTAIAFYLAQSIINYGAAKILKTQFQPPNYVMDTPIGDLNGFWLTWTYFGYSQTMAAILGWTQVIGSILLLFRASRLIGVFILLPVIVNIDLIDHFYTISPLAYFNALHYTVILLFLLLVDYELLAKTFFHYKVKFDLNLKYIALNVFRIALVAFSFFKINELRNSFEPKSKLNGTWQVQKYTKNGLDQPLSQNSNWSKMYLVDSSNKCNSF
jgi:hypothetical protein